MIRIGYEIASLIFLEQKDLLDYFRFWSFKFFAARKILSTIKYLTILNLAGKPHGGILVV